MGLDVRTRALGDLISLEPGFKVICEKVEELYGAKKIIKSGDWLVAHEEKGQTFSEFLKKPDRNEVTKNRNIIYLLIADKKIDADF